MAKVLYMWFTKLTLFKFGLELMLLSVSGKQALDDSHAYVQ